MPTGSYLYIYNIVYLPTHAIIKDTKSIVQSSLYLPRTLPLTSSKFSPISGNNIKAKRIVSCGRDVKISKPTFHPKMPGLWLTSVAVNHINNLMSNVFRDLRSAHISASLYLLNTSYSCIYLISRIFYISVSGYSCIRRLYISVSQSLGRNLRCLSY